MPTVPWQHVYAACLGLSLVECNQGLALVKAGALDLCCHLSEPLLAEARAVRTGI